MHVYVGTSGYSYKEWKPDFYPADVPATRFLAHYATKLEAVEINSTFYRFPTKKLLAGWVSEVPESFVFALKVPQKITHIARLKEVGDAVKTLLENVRDELGPRAGALDLQLPPNFKKDMGRLRDVFAAADSVERRPRIACEFRHPSWFDDEVHTLLADHDAALVLAESDDAEAGDDLDAPLIATAKWGYLRLRRTDYTDDKLRAWKTRLAAQKWETVYAFLKHEAVEAPLLATRLRSLLAE